MKIHLFVTICMFSIFTSDTQIRKTHIDIVTRMGVTQVSDIVDVQENSIEKLYKINTATPNTYTFTNTNVANDGNIFNYVYLNMAFVYFVSDSSINFTIEFKHVVDTTDATKNKLQTWTQADFDFVDQDSANNGKNPPTLKRRTYMGNFLVSIPAYVAGKLTIKFLNSSSAVFFLKNFRASFSKCQPDCNDCNVTGAPTPTYSCNTNQCTTGFVLQNSQCYCNPNGNVQLPFFNQLDNFDFRCFSTQANNVGSDYDLCNSFTTAKPTSLKLNYCNTCISGSSWKYSLNNPTGIICECPTNYSKVQKDNAFSCKSRIETECAGYPINTNEDTSDIINIIKTFSLKLDVNGQKDAITGETYYSVSLNPGTISQYLRLSYKLLITAPTYPLKIQNTYFRDAWLDSTSQGINLNLKNLQYITDCTKTQISNGANIWKCYITLIAFHPCRNFIYMNSKTQIEIGDGGVVKPSIEVNTNSNGSLINVPCIQSSTCFVNKDYSAAVTVCQDQACRIGRTTNFQIGDTVWLRASLTVPPTENPANYKITVESASFDLYDSSFVLQTSVSMTGKQLNAVDYANQPVFGFVIPITAEMMVNDAIVAGRLTLTVIFKVDKIGLRILEDTQLQKTSYSITEPVILNIIMNYNSDGSNTNIKKNDLEEENKSYLIAIIVFASVLAIIILGIVVYFIRKKSNNKNQGQEIPISDPSSRGKSAANYGNVCVPALKTLNYENNDQKEEVDSRL